MGFFRARGDPRARIELPPPAERTADLAAQHPLASLEADGLVRRSPTGIEVTDTGRLFIRNVAMCFDNALSPVGERKHSRTI